MLPYQEAFNVLGLEPHVSAEEIDARWRRIMLQAHPDKTNDDGRNAQLYNEAREAAKKYAKDPANQPTRDRDLAEYKCRRQTERVRFIGRMQLVFTNEFRKCFSNSYDASQYEKESADWTPQQRREAEEAMRYGLDKSKIDAALLENEKLRAENARLKASMAHGHRKAIEEATEAKDRVEAMADELQNEKFRASCLEKELADEKRRAAEVEAALKEEARASLAKEQKTRADLEEKLQDALQRQQEQDEAHKTEIQILQQSHGATILDLQKEIEGCKLHAEQMYSKKRKTQKQQTNERADQSKKIKEFVQNHMKTADEDRHKFLGTQTIYEAFQAQSDETESENITIIQFSIKLSKCIKEIYPSASDARNNKGHGYIGIQLK